MKSRTKPAAVPPTASKPQTAEIETGIPLPGARNKATMIYPFADLEVGQSFAVPLAEQGMLVARAGAWKKLHAPWDYTCRKDGERYRVWRLAGVLLAAVLLTTPALAWDNPPPNAAANVHTASSALSRATTATGPVAASGGSPGASAAVPGVGGG